MSIRWMTKVWDEALELEGTPLLVALCIADHAQDESGEAWPSVARIASRVRVTERAVYRALQTVEEAGWVERVARPGQSNIYRMVTPTPDASVTPEQMSPLTPASPTPDASVTPPLTPASPRTIREPSLEPDAAGDLRTEVTSSSDDEVSSDGLSRVRDIRPFPVVEQRKLVTWFTVNDPAAQEAWEASWRAAEGIAVSHAELDYDPQDHLAIYLSRCREERRRPRSDLWLRFFIEDRAKHIQVLREEAEQIDHHHETPQEREDRLNRRLPPAEWGLPPAAAETGDEQ